MFSFMSAGAFTKATAGNTVFFYHGRTEQIEAQRERLTEEAQAYVDEEAQAKAETLSTLPDETTQLNITYDEWTFIDASATENGFVLDTNVVSRGSDAPIFYMDGYKSYGERISSIFTPDETRPQLHLQPWEETAYFGTYENVDSYPWYAPVSELPETVLVAVLRNAGSHQMAKGGDENDPVTYTWDEIALLLRVNPRTGEITLPKDAAEHKEWKEEAERLAADGRNKRR